MALDPFDNAQAAYVKTQSILADNVNLKCAQGLTITDYERSVRTDDRREHQRVWKQVAVRGAGISISIAATLLAPVTVTGMAATSAVGAAGAVLEWYAAKDYKINNKFDYLDLAVPGVVGAALTLVPNAGGIKRSSAFVSTKTVVPNMQTRAL